MRSAERMNPAPARKLLADQAYDALKSSLQSGKYPPGTFLSERQLAAGGARLFAVSDDARVAANAAVHLPTATVSEWLSPLVSVLPVQKLAVAIAYARGLDPDNPRGLPQKVVRTL